MSSPNLAGNGGSNIASTPQRPQGQIVCGACRTLLLYPQGAQNVRCGRCSHINHAGQSSPDMAQLSCCNPHCRVQLMYPRGATQVQCSLCSTLNDAHHANHLGHLVCRGCQITLMYAHGAQSVKCSVCNVVTPVQSAQVGPSSAMQNTAVTPSESDQNEKEESQSDIQTILIENPSSVDPKNGREMRNVVLGVSSSKELETS